LPHQALKLRYIGWAITQGILLLIALFVFAFGNVFKQVWPWVLVFLFWAGQALYFFWMARRRFYREGYAVREKDIIHTRGYWVRTQLTVPYNRVQHVEIEQGPLARALGLGSISVYTAGDSGGDLSISGIEYTEAERIKQFIAQKVGTDE
jgi:membrane protein YdbS with pleckstrin-like domain